MDSGWAAILVAVGALFFSVFTYRKAQQQLIEGQNPLLSFHLYSDDGFLYLKVTNKGYSAAKNIKFKFLSISNNGNHNEFMLNRLFKYPFDLYPDESLEGSVGLFGENLTTEAVPVIDVNISFIRVDNNKPFSYQRKIFYTASNQIQTKVNVCIEEISEMRKMAADLRRIANYLDGCSIAPFDEINILSNRSLKKDLDQILIQQDCDSLQSREGVPRDS